jgi:hypothetical protein
MISKQNIRALLLCCSFLWPILSVAEDNSGTNPVNFTYDFRVYSELAQLPNDAGSSALTTAELRVPLGRDIAYLSDDPEESPFYDMGSRWQLRFRAKYKNLSLENPANPPFGASEVSGIGDFDARLLWIASASKKMVIAAGLEAFMDTASNDALGNGQWTPHQTMRSEMGRPFSVQRPSLSFPASGSGRRQELAHRRSAGNRGSRSRQRRIRDS